jgi:hypothetical protein
MNSSLDGITKKQFRKKIEYTIYSVLRDSAESQHAECKHAERQSAKSQDADASQCQTYQHSDASQCGTVKLSML